MLLWLLPPEVIAAQIRIVLTALWVAIIWATWQDYLSRPMARLRWHLRVRLVRAGRRFPFIPVLIPVLRKEPPAMGYMNRVIDLQFPDLAGLQEDSDRAVIWVKIKNPKLMVGDDVFTDAATNIQLGPDGQVIGGDVKKLEVYKSVAKLIIAGFVWDATVDSDDPPLVPMPPSPEQVGRMPIPVINAIADEIKKSSPK
jgi:hypothetical protein